MSARNTDRQETADLWKKSANDDTRMKRCTDNLNMTLIENQPQATQN